MTHTCPKGHQSDWEDFCSTCGASISAPTGAAVDGASTVNSGDFGGSCTNCQTPYQHDDVFCERCGYDFATGTLPEEDTRPETDTRPEAREAPPEQDETASPPVLPATTAGAPELGDAGGPTPAAPAAEEAGVSSPTSGTATPPDADDGAGISTAVVAVDEEYFNRVAAGADLQPPDPVPQPTRIPLTGDMVLIGRHNQKRGVYPEIDIDKLTADPAASTRHAMLKRSGDGRWTINDLGSTNGTLIDDDTDAITPGIELDLTTSSRLYLGAWTLITFE